MNRFTFAIIAVAVVATSTLTDANAQPCEAKAKATACFVDHALDSLQACQVMSLSGTGNLACIAEGEARIEPLYEEAIYASERNGHTQLLKDFHASWLVAMNGVRPVATERPATYKARQTANKNALDAKAELLKVD